MAAEKYINEITTILAESRKIKIDEYDIDKVELYSLRRQIGVPQEFIILRDNI